MIFVKNMFLKEMVFIFYCSGGKIMQKSPWFRKGLTVGIILLFIGIAVTPHLNLSAVSATSDNEFVKGITQACDNNGPHPGGHFVGILVLLGSCYSAERNLSNITFQGKSILVFGFAYWDEEGTIAMLSPGVGALNATIYTSQFHGVCSAHLICGMILGSWEESDLYG